MMRAQLDRLTNPSRPFVTDVPVENERISNPPYLELMTAKGKRYLPLVGRSYWTVGRGKENDLVITDQCISRNHAILQSTETKDFYLIDLGSRNGTFVNDRRVSIPVTLQHGDQITFGKTKVEFYCPDSPPLSGSLRAVEGGTLTSALHERRLMSVLVVDMRNFTVLARQLDDSMLSSLLGNWFREAGNIIRKSGSWVDKYIGDAVMAVWFHEEESVTREDIMGIFRSVGDLNEMTSKLSAQYPLPFDLRIGAGINTGYAMVGNTGSGDHPDYTAIGDTVNAAFRLESTTKEIGLDMAIGETTYHYLMDFKGTACPFQAHRVTLKGYEFPTLTYGITFDKLADFLAIDTRK